MLKQSSNIAASIPNQPSDLAAVWATLKKILKPVASLRLTVVLLALSMLLVYAGTWAQVSLSNWDVQKLYFYSTWVWVPLKTFFIRVESGAWSIPGSIPLPGGYILGLLLLINLLAAHSVRFKLSWKRSGIIMIHLGLILLLVGEGVSSRLKIESLLQVDEGSYARYTIDSHDLELSVTQVASGDADDYVTVIPATVLEKGGTVSTAALPFQVRVDAFYPNSEVVGRPSDNGPRATAGIAASGMIAARGIPKVAGTGDSAKKMDQASVYVTPIIEGKAAGTYLCSMIVLNEEYPQIDASQPLQVDGKTYNLQLRFKRTYKPYTVYLKKFRFDRYTGTNNAKNFSSEIRLVDPGQHEDRMVKIWMNHPLRYEGETFFQSNFNHETERGTVLMVVRNPAWRMPYISCIVGGIGLLVHFGMMLINFARKRFAEDGILHIPLPRGLFGGVFMGITAAAVLASRGPKRRGNERGGKAGSPVLDAELQTPSRWDLIVPAIAGVITLLWVIAQLFPKSQESAFDIRAFSQLPVSSDGRIQPLGSVALVTLRSLCGKDHLEAAQADGTHELPAASWLADVMLNTEKAADYKCIRIDYPELTNRLSDDPQAKFFSVNQVLARWDELGPQIRAATDMGEDKKLTQYQQKLLELNDKLRLFMRIAGPRFPTETAIFHIDHSELKETLGLPAKQRVFSLEDLLSSQKFPEIADLLKIARQPARADNPLLNPMIAVAKSVMSFVGDPRNPGIRPNQGLRVVPPRDAGDDWHSVEASTSQTRQSGGEPERAAVAFSYLQQTYADPHPDVFNSLVGAYTTSLEKQFPTEFAHVSFETRFNAFNPFFVSLFIYLIAFMLICVSWLIWRGPLYRTAAVLIGIALVVHTCGLIGRIYISGRPPVTNLTSASIFIAWGMVLLALGLEFFYRNTMGLLAAAAAGFCSLLLADQLTLQEGDTLKVLQAVLDTNFWLATHVVCVTLGYATTALAGVLGIVYIIRGVFTESLDKEESRELAKMIYGVICFAMFFSFVGTVLGGIWADQSWGRFWGWDSKENGAVLVVLTNAILLHARWGGMIRERGMAVLAVWGIMVTEWSFFGTNQLGVGLHAYGFTEGLWRVLCWFWGLWAVFIITGLLPQHWWASRQTQPGPAGTRLPSTSTGMAAT